MESSAEHLLQRQSLEKSCATLRERVEKLRAENADLKKKRAKSEKDTHEFVAYFQKEMEKKDEMIAQLNTSLVQKELQYEREKEEMRSSYEDQLATQQQTSSEKVESLNMQLRMVGDELTVLNDFKEMKVDLEKKLDQTAQDLVTQQQNHQQTINAMERKFLEEKARIQKDVERRIEEIKRKCREEAQQGLDADTRKIITDNRRMGEELRFQLQTTDELQRAKTQLEEEKTRLAREVGLFTEKEREYAKQGYRQSREIKELQHKVKSLERSLSQVVRDFEKEKEMIILQHKQQVEELKIEESGLRQLVKLKNKELKNIRKLAQIILDQRTEVEQFFLEALEQVKSEVRREREERHKQAVAQYRSQMREATSKSGGGGGGSGGGGGGGRGHRFPAIRAPQQLAAAGGAASRLPMQPNSKVDLRDLSWQDRERVLRLLFAKINNVQGRVDVLPSHTFDSALQQQQQLRAVEEQKQLQYDAGMGGHVVKIPGSGAVRPEVV